MRALIALALLLIVHPASAQRYKNAFVKIDPMTLSISETVNVSVVVGNIDQRQSYPVALISATLMDPKGNPLDLANTAGIRTAKERHHCNEGAILTPGARQIAVFRFKGTNPPPKGEDVLLLDIIANLQDGKGCQLFSVSLPKLKPQD